MQDGRRRSPLLYCVSDLTTSRPTRIQVNFTQQLFAVGFTPFMLHCDLKIRPIKVLWHADIGKCSVGVESVVTRNRGQRGHNQFVSGVKANFPLRAVANAPRSPV